MLTIYHSLSESQALGLKVGRASWDSRHIPVAALKQAIIKDQYDCCILKLDSKSPTLMTDLSELQFIYGISGITRRYLVDYRKYTFKPYFFPNWSEELYDGSVEKVALLKRLVWSIFSDEPLMYYHLPFYQHLVDKQNELEALFLFLKEFDNVKQNGIQKRLFFFKDESGYFGLTAMTYTDGETTVESNITGIIPSYRGKGYYKDLIRFNQNHHWESGMDFCTCGARIQNIPAQRAFVKENMYVKNYVFGIYLFPFLQKTNVAPIRTSIQLEKQNKIFQQIEIVQQVQQIVAKHWTGFKNINQLKWVWNQQEQQNSIAQLVLSFPISTPSVLLLVVQLKDKHNHVVGILYLEYVNK